MAKVERVQKTKAAPQKEEVVEVEPKVPENVEELKSELDELLDEIDELLETNAAEFVKSYVQKGGQVSQVLLEVWYNIRRGFELTILRRSSNEGLLSIKL